MNQTTQYAAVLSALFFFVQTAGADEEADQITGIWATAKAEAHVEVSKNEKGYYGTIIWLNEPFFPEDDEEGMAGQAKVDRENPDPDLRMRPIIGTEIMSGFQYVGGNLWRDGTIYDPNNGKTYKCKIWLTDKGTLKVRGYIGVSLFGRTEVWTPVIHKR
ncbi:MAG: DUF2147 domain-containing protein [Gammaproteobacteria bacterium]|nr:DUF2147 domain-containing protein [Gammaproteobacteria bacterium]